MNVFRGIEGARAWLAWTVVIAHVFILSGLAGTYPWADKIGRLGNWPVNVSLIISGFVITNLIIAKKEPYFPYIGRQFLRLYPAYFVCLMLALLVQPLGFKA